MSILEQQPAHFEAALLKIMESMVQQFSQHFAHPESSGKHFTSADAVAVCIIEFLYDHDSGGVFDAWFKLWENIFHVELAKADDAWKFTRFSFGVKTAPAIFQQIMNSMLTGIEGSVANLDNSIVTGSNPDELLKRSETVPS
ncbi:unnamed protein product [Schistocephalus solidus]|uniref:GLOBIN domain-containing protein n=1 Tax=Schistocephalus solidus TaxID=70667 RepID=A0A183SUB8_SCHSO|nr:unnamed protein product [Schistocephalus solidus]